MTGSRSFHCLQLLTVLLSFHAMDSKINTNHPMETHINTNNAMDTQINNNYAYFHLRPLIESGQVQTSHGPSTLDKIVKADLFSNFNSQLNSRQTSFRLPPHGDQMYDTIQNSSETFLMHRPKVPWNYDHLIRNSWHRSRTLRHIQDTTASLSHNKVYHSEVNEVSAFPNEFVKLKLPYVGDEFRNNIIRSPIGRGFHAMMIKFRETPGENLKTDEANSRGIVNDFMKKETKRTLRSRFPRDTHEPDFLERNDFRTNEVFPGKDTPGINFGLDLHNEALIQWLDDLALDEASMDAARQLLHDPSIDTSPEAFDDPVPDVQDPRTMDLELADAPTDIERSIRDMTLFLLQRRAQDDDSSSYSKEESAGLIKRDNSPRQRIYELIRRERPNRVRMTDKHQKSSRKERPLDSPSSPGTVGSCEPETDGTQPMRCPSDTHRCLYDSMICDGVPQCPQGEDETFSVCLLRHWTDRLMRKFHQS